MFDRKHIPEETVCVRNCVDRRNAESDRQMAADHLKRIGKIEMAVLLRSNSLHWPSRTLPEKLRSRETHGTLADVLRALQVRNMDRHNGIHAAEASGFAENRAGSQHKYLVENFPGSVSKDCFVFLLYRRFATHVTPFKMRPVSSDSEKVQPSFFWETTKENGGNPKSFGIPWDKTINRSTSFFTVVLIF